MGDGVILTRGLRKEQEWYPEEKIKVGWFQREENGNLPQMVTDEMWK